LAHGRRALATFRSSGVPALGVAVLALACLGGASWIAHVERAAHVPGRAGDRRDMARSVLRVPHAPAPIVLDGDNDDPGWLAAPGPARTGPFVSASGAAARPYSDARLLWGDGHLYLLLYAADEDVRSQRDAFRLTFSRAEATYALAVSADGALHDEARDANGRIDASWRSGAHVSREIDGTLDDPRDTDEEWSLEMALPLASLGMKSEPGERVGFAIERCEAPEQGDRGCGRWDGDGRERGQLVLE
jgi:hypothetical protein